MSVFYFFFLFFYLVLYSLFFFFFFFLMIRRPPRSTLFPYTRSSDLSSIRSPGRVPHRRGQPRHPRSEEHTSELQSRQYLVCRLLLEKKKKQTTNISLINAKNQIKTITNADESTLT